MQTLKYKGEGPAELEIPGCGKVRRGNTIDVPDELAAAMLATNPQDWEKPGTRTSRARSEDSEEGE